jgi:chromatin remodeling complex protein RSC6
MTTSSKLSTTTVSGKASAVDVPATKVAATKATKTVAAATPAPAVAAPVETKKVAAKKTVTAPAAPAAAPVTVETPVATVESTTTSEGAASTPEDTFSPRFAALLERLQGLTNDVREVTTSIRVLQKEHTRFVRENSKKNTKRLNRVKRTASGFAKPTLLSDEMYDFLAIEKNTLVVRNDVTRKLNEYVLSNNLRDSKDKRNIIPDAKMRKLLNFTDGDSLTYFNIQKYIKHHFVKPVATA